MVDPFRHSSEPENEDPRMQRPTTRRDWEELPSDPDLIDDLGYELLDLEAYETDEDHILFLPQDEDMLRDEAFIVVRKEHVRSFGE